MNDDFLYKLRIDPPPAFAARLQARLERRASPARRAARWSLLALLCGTAFALVSPAVRNVIGGWAAPADSNTVPPGAAPATPPATGPAMPSAPAPSRESRAVAGPPAGDSGTSAPAPRGRSAPITTFGSPHTSAQAPALAVGPDAQIARASPLAQQPAGTTLLPGTALPNISLLSAAAAADTTPQQLAIQATAARRGLFKVMDWAMRPVQDMLLDRKPYDARELATQAGRIRELAALIGPVFQPDTRGFSSDTAALDRIWTDTQDFDSRASQLAAAAGTLVMAAQSADRAAAMRAAAHVAAVCAACHELYRGKLPDHPE